MTAKEQQLTTLLKAYTGNTATPQEEITLMQLLSDPALETRKQELADHYYDTLPADKDLSPQDADKIFTQIITRSTKPAHRVHFLKTPWLRYAALLLLIAGTATYLYTTSPSFRRKPEVTKTATPPQPQDIAPGTTKATLTLADGSTIVLDSAANGALAQQGATKIIKLNEGSLAYNNGSNVSDDIGMNTITTPKGGQYQITLPDGTKVWLNAASSIKFPTAFTKDRKVTLTGEACFEIAKDKSKPFSVQAHTADIQVLGTTFNINAYTDEPALKTTLLEGSVKVTYKGEAELLKPGQQAVIKENLQVNNKVNIDQVMAWKNGRFNFENTTLQEMMRQIARWYNIDIIYEGTIAPVEFQGKIGRDLNLSDVLEILKKSEVNFKLEGRKLFIMP